jgi:hypothetical protein
LAIFIHPVGPIQPFFKRDIKDDLIFFSQGNIDVTAMHMIGVGLFVIWRLKLDNESYKIFLAHSVFGGTKSFINTLITSAKARFSY